MKNKTQKYILMYQNFEVLKFEVDIANSKILSIEELEHFDKAPYVFKKEGISHRLALTRFINGRLIASNRWDYEDIIKAVGVKNSFELFFKGHGLSLSNHYWMKKEGENLRYEDINFFTNKWDDSFARAVLSGRYEDLKHCDLNVPDIATAGWSVKGWLCEDDGPKLYKVGLVKDHCEDSLGEVLVSRLARRILKEGEVVKYELKQIYDKYASVSSPMIGLDEELIPLSNILPNEIYDIYRAMRSDKTLVKTFFDKVAEFGMPELFELFVKVTVIRTICFVSDLHFDNISVIRNIKTGKIKVAPLYDLAGGFGSGRSARDLISSPNKGTYIIIYYLFSGLDPSWDYSWYDPDRLIGFEEEIKEVFSHSDFYTQEILDRIIAVYEQQKSSLDDIAKQSLKNK